MAELIASADVVDDAVAENVIPCGREGHSLGCLSNDNREFTFPVELGGEPAVVLDRFGGPVNSGSGFAEQAGRVGRSWSVSSVRLDSWTCST